MKRSFNKILLSVPAFLVCSSLLYPIQALSQQNYVDNSGMNGWSIGAGIDYKQFSNNGTNFASTLHDDFNIDTDYHTGFNAWIGYRIPVKNSDIRLDYSHIKTTDS